MMELEELPDDLELEEEEVLELGDEGGVAPPPTRPNRGRFGRRGATVWDDGESGHKHIGGGVDLRLGAKISALSFGLRFVIRMPRVHARGRKNAGLSYSKWPHPPRTPRSTC